jgi:NADH dehydrogenase
LLSVVARQAGLTPRLLPLPFAAWHALARVAELLPNPPITRNQVELMEVDTVVSPNVPGLHELGISRHSIEDVLRQIVAGH